MTEDLVLDATADFIRGSKTNLELALQVERAMPYVREQLFRTALEAVEECFPQGEWSTDRSAMQDVMATGASLVLRREAWRTIRSDPAIWLGTDLPCWRYVWIGFYFTKRSSRKVQPFEQTVTSLAERGYTTVDASEDELGAYKYFDGELRDWSDERFLTRIVDEGPDRIASEISDELKQIDKFVDTPELIPLCS